MTWDEVFETVLERVRSEDSARDLKEQKELSDYDDRRTEERVSERRAFQSWDRDDG